MTQYKDSSLTGTAADGIYGLPATRQEAALVYIPVPWEVTTSYGGGTAQGPEAILQASPQLDLYQRGMANHYEKGFFVDVPPEGIATLNQQWKPVAKQIQQLLEEEGSLAGRDDLQALQQAINAASRQVNQAVYQRCGELDAMGKLLGLIGGDHSSPYGLIRFLGEKFRGDFGVLHIDAHLDLRDAYQGFDFSHASIMRNVMALEYAPRSLVQVGIRDFCEAEATYADAHPAIHVFYDEDIKAALYQGDSFAGQVGAMVAALPQNVYISFDIDGLRPDLCPHTGTPVAGGLEFEQARFLIAELVRSGRRIIGFDLCEVSPNPNDPQDEWDGNVGARVLFMLSSWMMESQ